MSHPSVAERLSRLAPDQRAAATAASGPLLVVAPAGSGKTTTLVARVAWLVDGGVDPASVTLVAFNKRAAEELTERLDGALAPLGVAAGAVRVRTFHALGREILVDAGVPVDPLIDRDELLRALFPEASAGERGRLDLAFSRLKLDLQVTVDEVAADPAPGPMARAFVAYERAIRETGGVDFDDLVVRALECLRADPALLARWRARTRTLLVDEAQDVDRLQLDLALLLAAPANDVCLVGDDDQSIYGWRLADVRRILSLEDRLPGLRRVDLEVNYRCPKPVVARAVRLIEHNGERFAKTIRARPGAAGRLVLAADTSDETVRIERAMRSWPDDGSTRAVLARTNRELLPAVVVCLGLGVPFRAPRIELLLDSPLLDELLERAAEPADGAPLLVALGRVRDAAAGDPESTEVATALLGWAAALPPTADLAALGDTILAMRARLADLRRDDADLTLATAHATKGLEFDHVAVVGMEAGRFPSARAVGEAEDPDRAYEEERRLAYVAWTRARRSLTLVYDPTTPSPFLLEAFDAEELGLSAGVGPPTIG
ncbi:MAG TPA: ATP-dependent helicase [Candidatus Limnocylindrales bacterium]|nr:ATP-dependent helicase [Candidatus Limnocylindrales bacterium]